VAATIIPLLLHEPRQAQLVLRSHAAEDVQLRQPAHDLLVGKLLELAAADGARAEPERRPDGTRGDGVVAVIMRTSMPTRSAVSTASLASGRSGSIVPTIPTNPRSRVIDIGSATIASTSSSAITRAANASTRSHGKHDDRCEADKDDADELVDQEAHAG
jgi:hypothetical protein